MVEVSTSSVRRVRLDSNSSRQTCFGSRALTFMWLDPLSESAQDLLCDSVRCPVFQQPLGQGTVSGQSLQRPLSCDLGHDLRGLVLQPLLGLLPGLAPSLSMLAVGVDRRPELLDPFLTGRRGGDDRLL